MSAAAGVGAAHKAEAAHLLQEGCVPKGALTAVEGELVAVCAHVWEHSNFWTLVMEEQCRGLKGVLTGHIHSVGAGESHSAPSLPSLAEQLYFCRFLTGRWNLWILINFW